MGAELLALGLVAFLLTYWLHSTVLLAAARLIARRLDPDAAGLRESVWRVALLGGLVTAGLQTGLGIEPTLGRWFLRPGSPTETAALESRDLRGTGVEGASAAPDTFRVPPAAEPPALLVSGSEPAPALPEVGDVPASPAEPSVRPAGLATVPTAAVDRSAVDPSAGARPEAATHPRHAGLGALAELPWPRWIAAGWLAGALLACGFLLACRRRLQRGLAGRVELVDGPLVRTLARLHARSGRRRRPRLFVAPRLAVPLCTGILRPAICIPPRALSELTRTEQEAMLAHELGHLVRRDPLWTCLTWTVQTVFFFQPQNRLARRELLAAAELLADDWAAGITGRRLPLASCLTRIATWLVGDAQPLLAPQMTRAEGRSHLGVRVERLLDGEDRGPQPRRRWSVPAACACLATLALAVPGFAAVEPRREADRAPRPEPARRPTLESALELAAEPAPAPLPEPAATAVAVPRAHRRAAPEPAANEHGATDHGEADAQARLVEELNQLNAEAQALEGELAQLREELAGRNLDASVRTAVAELTRRTRALADRRGRVNSLIRAARAAQSRSIRP